jgi:hypothetical protein
LSRHRLPYLSKPFRVEELTQQVRQTLASHSLAAKPSAFAAKNK